MKQKTVSFVGSKGVGKSSIISQIVYRIFPETHHKDLKHICKYQRADTVYEFRCINSEHMKSSQTHLRHSHMIVYVYAWDDPSSYRWVQTHLQRHPKGVPAIVVCNKIDLSGNCGETFLANDGFCLQRLFLSAKEDMYISHLFRVIESVGKYSIPTVQRNACCLIL